MRGDRPTPAALRFAPHDFYRRWIVANGWSEALGLGTTFLIGGALAPWLEIRGVGGTLPRGR